MRADEHGVAHCCWVARPAAYQGVLHNHHVVADPDLTILGRKHGAVQHSGTLAECYGTAKHSRRRHVCGFRDYRPLSTMGKDHGPAAYSVKC